MRTRSGDLASEMEKFALDAARACSELGGHDGDRRQRGTHLPGHHLLQGTAFFVDGINPPLVGEQHHNQHRGASAPRELCLTSLRSYFRQGLTELEF